MKNINTTEELERIEGKELHKEIHYIYIQNKRTFAQELLLCLCKSIIIMLVISYFLSNFPAILDNLNLTNILSFDGVAY